MEDSFLSRNSWNQFPINRLTAFKLITFFKKKVFLLLTCFNYLKIESFLFSLIYTVAKMYHITSKSVTQPFLWLRGTKDQLGLYSQMQLRLQNLLLHIYSYHSIVLSNLIFCMWMVSLGYRVKLKYNTLHVRFKFFSRFEEGNGLEYLSSALSASFWGIQYGRCLLNFWQKFRWVTWYCVW